MKNRKLWITSAVLAAVIIIVVLVVKLGGRKVKMSPSAKDYRVWIFGIENGEVIKQHYYDNSLEYVLLPYKYDEIEYTYNGVKQDAPAIPVKAIGFISSSGKVKRIYQKRGSYISKAALDI